VRVVFWLDLAIWLLVTALSMFRLAPFAAAFILVAFGFVDMGRKALWTRAAVALVVGGIAALVTAWAGLLSFRGGAVLWELTFALTVFLWQVLAAVASVQGLLVWSRSESKWRRDVARVRPLPAGKRHFLRPGRRSRSDARPRALYAVVILDVLAAVIAFFMFVMELGQTPDLREMGGIPPALSLSLPAFVLASLCWDRHPLALRARPWFGGGVALVSAAVAGIGSPWTIALLIYAVLAGLAITRARRLLEEAEATQSDSGSRRPRTMEP
jgi:hypothetical protein